MRSVLLTVLVLVAALPAVAACGGDDAEAKTKKTVVQLDGIYKPSDANGAIASITFSGGVNYMLMPSRCSGSDCAEIGTYRIDQEKSTLWLENGKDHVTRPMPFEVLATTRSKAALVKQSLRIMDDLVDPGDESLAGQFSQLIDLVKEMITDGMQLTQQDPGDPQDPNHPASSLWCWNNVPTNNATLDERAAYFAVCPDGP